MTTEDITDASVEMDKAVISETDTDQIEDRADTSRQLLAKARYDGFKLMTETRQEAEDILLEARTEAVGITNAAEIAAAAIVENAKARAEETVTAATEEGAAIVARAHRTAGEEALDQDSDALRDEHRKLTDRVSTLKTLADQLEDRFAALAATTSQSAETSVPKAKTSPKIDYSPTVEAAPTEKDDAESTETAPSASRGSFYNRRSANLPRLGRENGEDVATMTRALRKSLDTEKT